MFGIFSGFINSIFIGLDIVVNRRISRSECEPLENNSKNNEEEKDNKADINANSMSEVEDNEEREEIKTPRKEVINDPDYSPSGKLAENARSMSRGLYLDSEYKDHIPNDKLAYQESHLMNHMSSNAMAGATSSVLTGQDVKSQALIGAASGFIFSATNKFGSDDYKRNEKIKELDSRVNDVESENKNLNERLLLSENKNEELVKRVIDSENNNEINNERLSALEEKMRDNRNKDRDEDDRNNGSDHSCYIF